MVCSVDLFSRYQFRWFYLYKAVCVNLLKICCAKFLWLGLNIRKNKVLYSTVCDEWSGQYEILIVDALIGPFTVSPLHCTCTCTLYHITSQH